MGGYSGRGSKGPGWGGQPKILKKSWTFLTLFFSNPYNFYKRRSYIYEMAKLLDFCVGSFFCKTAHRPK